jgi:hypothetical protein
VKEWKMFLQAIEIQNKTRVPVVISDKVNFKPKLIKRNEMNSYQKDMVAYIHELNAGAPNFIKHNCLQKDI